MQGYKRIFIFVTIGMVMLASASFASAQEEQDEVERYIQQLKSEDMNVRVMAAQVLGQLGDVRAVVPLIATFKHEDINVRSAAAFALGQLGKPAVEPLLLPSRMKI